MNAGFSETHLIVIFTNSIKTSLSLSAFSKRALFSPPSPVFLHVVISLRLPMVFNSSFMLGAFYKLYSHGLLARPPTEPACLNSICLHPRHIQQVKNGSSPAPSPPPPAFLPSCKAKVGVEKGTEGVLPQIWQGWGAPLAPLMLPDLFGELCKTSIPQRRC